MIKTTKFIFVSINTRNCGAGEGSWESLEKQGDRTSQMKTNPDYSLEGLMMKLKLQYCGHLMWRTDSLEKTLRIEGRRRRGWDGWMASLTGCTWVWAISRNWWWTGNVAVHGSQRAGHDWATELKPKMKSRCFSQFKPSCNFGGFIFLFVWAL